MSDQLAPPWREFPDLAAGHIGWRMGPGEAYLIRFGQWITTLSEEERRNYIDGLKPIPRGWLDFAIGVLLYPSCDEDATDDEWARAHDFASSTTRNG